MLSSSEDGLLAVLRFESEIGACAKQPDKLRPHATIAPFASGAALVGHDSDVLGRNALVAAPAQWALLNLETQKTLIGGTEGADNCQVLYYPF